MPQKFRQLNRIVDTWFTQPETNAAGNMGLFRIFYALFYLWHLSTHSAVFLSGMPSFFVEQPVYVVGIFFRDYGASFSPTFFYTLESLLVAALVLLLWGYQTRLSTVLVLLLGCLIEGLSSAIDSKRTLLPLVFYIPLLMLFIDSWGCTYSIDALLKKRRRGYQVSPHASDWQYFLPARALLVIFSVQFFISAVFKVTFGGAWLSHVDMMANFFLNRNIEAAVYQLPLNPLAPFIAQTPLIYLAVHATTLIFEFCFFVTLINRKLRDLIVSLALIFHAVNALWLVVTVTPILVGYLAFVDWQHIRDRLLPMTERGAYFPVIPSRVLVFSVLFLATLLGLLWHSSVGVRDLVNGYGMINWRTIWLPVLPLSLGWFLVTLWQFRQPVKAAAIDHQV